MHHTTVASANPQQYKVRSVELRGENQETLEVCLANVGADESSATSNEDDIDCTPNVDSGIVDFGAKSEQQQHHDFRGKTEQPPGPPSSSSPCLHCPPPCSDPQVCGHLCVSVCLDKKTKSRKLKNIDNWYIPIW